MLKKFKKKKKLIAGLALTSMLIGSGSALAATYMYPGPQPNGTGVTPHGWTVTPAGKQLKLGDKPFGGVISPDQRYLVVSNDGLTKSLQVVDLQQNKVVSEVDPSDDNLWFGLAFSPDGKTLYASGLNNNIRVYHFDNGTLTEQAPIVLGDANTTFSPAGMSVSADGKFLYVANNLNNSVSCVDLTIGKIKKTTTVGNKPYTAFLSHDGSKLFVTNWGENSVSVLNPNDLSVEKTITVGLHPNAVAQNPKNGFIYVSNSDSDEISIIDPNKQQVIQTISLAPYRGAQTGSQPNAMTVSPDGQTLYVSNAGNNDIAVVDIGGGKAGSEAKVKGLIPTAWYPTGVFLTPDSKQLMALNSKGLGYGSNTDGTYIGNLIKGTMSIIDLPTEEQLKDYTKQVDENNNVPKANGDGWLSRGDNFPIPRSENQKSPIKHVIYVVKENHTYDEVFGDLGKGNGDPSLTEFGQKITPNLHKLANQFVTLDNFYEDGECSADGHDWTTAAKANDYKEKDYRAWDHIYDYQGRDHADYSQEGHIWNSAAKAGLSFRMYGEFAVKNNTTGLWQPTDNSIGSNFDPNYAGFDMTVTDQSRFDEWNKEFQQFVKNGNLPNLEVLHLPDDHTAGDDPSYRTPQAMVADNDLAVGKIVNTVSHSQYWKDTAIFVVEDDAQSGPDHVESHRTEALVISPYTQTGKLDSTFYDTTSMLRTMELFLGMKPMTQYDGSATPMLNAFTDHPNFTQYQVEQPQYPIYLMNGQTAPTATQSQATQPQVTQSQKMDFSKPDANDPDKLNRVIWKATMGDKPYPGSKK